MTKTTSLIVTLDSAMFVDRIICEKNRLALNIITFYARHAAWHKYHKTSHTNIQEYNMQGHCWLQSKVKVKFVYTMCTTTLQPCQMQPVSVNGGKLSFVHFHISVTSQKQPGVINSQCSGNCSRRNACCSGGKQSKSLSESSSSLDMLLQLTQQWTSYKRRCYVFHRKVLSYSCV